MVERDYQDTWQFIFNPEDPQQSQLCQAFRWNIVEEFYVLDIRLHRQLSWEKRRLSHLPWPTDLQCHTMPGLSAPVTSCKLNLTTIKRLVFCVKLFNLDSQTVYSPIPVFPLGMQIVLHGRSLGSACRAKRIRRTCLMQLSDSTRWHLRLIYIYML